MSHLDEGTIVAIRDGALVGGDASEHLAACSQCRTGLDDARRRAELIAGELAGLDTPVDTVLAKEAVRKRLDSARDPSRGPGRTLWHLGRAAAVLLAATGAAYALPGSPVPGWFSSTDVVPAVGPDVVDRAQEPPLEGGIEVSVPEGRMQIFLNGVTPGSELVIVWVDAPIARIAAAPGSSFSFTEGRAEATVAPGPVRVELPRFAQSVSVAVDGRTYLRRTSAGLEVMQPTVVQTDERIRFVIRDR